MSTSAHRFLIRRSIISESKLFWLSFVTDDKPEGERFLGAAIVEVTSEEAAEALEEIRVKFLRAIEGAEWIAAASRKAWRTGCNPGGEMGSCEIPPDAPREILDAPRHELMQRTELSVRGIAI